MKEDTVLKAIKSVKGVRKAYFTFGRFDIAAFLEVESYESLRNFTAEINALEGIRSTETLPEV